jgi:hypothetical protein
MTPQARREVAERFGRAELHITRQLRCEHLHGDLAVKARIPGLIHLADASHADEGEDFVRAEPCARLQNYYLFTLSSIQMLPVA